MKAPCSLVTAPRVAGGDEALACRPSDERVAPEDAEDRARRQAHVEVTRAVQRVERDGVRRALRASDRRLALFAREGRRERSERVRHEFVAPDVHGLLRLALRVRRARLRLLGERERRESRRDG